MDSKIDLPALLESSFNFLLEYGFRRGVFYDFPQRFGNWKLFFSGETCVLEIYSDRGVIDAAFSLVDQSSKKGFSLAAAIYLVTNGETFFGNFYGDLDDKKIQIDRVARILKQYIDEILKGIPLWRDRSELIDDAVQAVFNLTIEEYNRYQQNH